MPSDTRDVQILPLGTEPAPADFVLPAAAEIIPKAVFATFDGSGAATGFKPTLEIISDSGHAVAFAPTDETVAAGGSATVSWFPKWKRVSGGGICPGFPGGDVCGGINNVGAFAEGHGGGLTTVLTVNRTVNCQALIVVVGCALSAPGDGGAIIQSCVDSRGTRYFSGISSIEGALAGPDKAVEVSMAFTMIASGGLSLGNTITVTWDPSVTVSDAECMAFALTNLTFGYSDSANGITFPGTLGTSPTVIQWGLSVGLPVADFTGFVGASVCAIGCTPAVGVDFTQATLLDTASTANVTLGVGLIPSLVSGDVYEPGGVTGGATVSVANYSEITG